MSGAVVEKSAGESARVSGDARIAVEAGRRRTFAVISHPDAGKSTLTEALALYAEVIDEAGAVHGKSGRRGVTSDWMEMERKRGISVTSAVLQFAYRDCVINLLDTPGHGDFSEDTYRVLAAVDAAVMLLDAAKGLEPQTLKLFDVCRTRGIPVLTFVNKWDRPGREALELLDEVEQTIGLRPMPVTWPVGVAGELRGLVEVATGEFRRYSRTAGGATRATTELVPAEVIAAEEPQYWAAAQDELALLEEIGAGFDEKDFLTGTATPVLFGAALNGVGVARLLDALVELAPAPEARDDAEGNPRPLEASTSGLVFKVQAGMDRAHRDRMAFVRICSGRFERGMVLTHAATGRPFATKYAQAVFGQQRTTVEEAFPGDIVGLVNAGALRPGDTLYSTEPVQFPAIPSFAPEHFAVVRGADAGTYKQFRRGIEQLDSEGVIQVLSSDLRGDQAPVLAAVGPLQFEVVTARLESEFRAPVTLETLSYSVTRRTDAAGAELLKGQSEVEVLTRRADGAVLALFSNKWRLETIRRKFDGLVLDALPAGSSER
ncbi:peptide chain release factor 3 [Pseudonocardia xinjiangensis]|uniref:Peptide chain release factor 3 n=1 Tax=Pseudonocardia xinjiangensis TaxID=75289 RepID=A0ABX1RG04_9PSEU|nr:peptide chain release factor 3 [Pseudonocardia xinjiangensis]NMH78101.1 peptide chain release factor 3 [Pseudonocardia xinjiangensis]